MKVLLVKPQYVFNSHHPVQFTGAERALPLSLAYLAAVLEREGHVVRVVDYQVERPPIVEVLRQFRPDMVGLTAYSKEFPHALSLTEAIKGFAPGIPILLGGPHVNAYKEGVFSQTNYPDYLVCQEGEETLRELAACLENNGNPQEVAGLIFRDDSGRNVSTGPRRFVADLDALPFMALHHFRVGKYHPAAGTFRRLPSVTMITSRGCPYKCIFCNTDLFGKNIRLRSAENVLEEIEQIVKKYGAREINFCDESLTINRHRMEAICEGLIRRNLRIGWKCSTRVDLVDPELLKLMKRSGCFYIGYGVESGVQAMLERLQKGITLEQIRRTFEATRRAGITTMAYFMMNIPGETREDIEESIRFSREIRPDFLNFELIKPYGGTRLRQMIEDEPRIKINKDLWENWESYSAGNHLFYSQEGISEQYICDAYKRAVKDFYLRPGFILKAFLQLRSIEQFMIYFKYFINMLFVRMVMNK